MGQGIAVSSDVFRKLPSRGVAPNMNLGVTLCLAARVAPVRMGYSAGSAVPGTSVVIDGACVTSPSAVQRLAEHLDRPGAASKTGQSAGIRTDRVAFVGRGEARACGLQNEYDMLMAIAAGVVLASGKGVVQRAAHHAANRLS